MTPITNVCSPVLIYCLDPGTEDGQVGGGGGAKAKQNSLLFSLLDK